LLAQLCCVRAVLSYSFLLSVLRHRHSATHSPYTTLFRSRLPAEHGGATADTRPGGLLHRAPLAARTAVCRQSSDPSGKLPASCRSEEHTSELQSRENLVCRLLLDNKHFFVMLAPLCPFSI